MNRIIFLIDGFNLYHSAVDLLKDKDICAKWLDIRALCQSYVSKFGSNARLERIYYFSAIARHLRHIDPNKIKRHKKYIMCLKSTGIQIELGRFKEKSIRCNKCKAIILRHEEKETDVTIAVKVVEIFLKNDCEIAIIVTGDTDLAPAIRTCRELFPKKKIIFCFPYKRRNNELLQLAPGSFDIIAEKYTKYQFPNPVVLEDGSEIYKPDTW